MAPDRAEVRVGTHAVAVVAPRGFCVDPESLRVAGDGLFLLLADCSLTEGRGGRGRAAMTLHLSESPLFSPQEDRRETLERLGKFL
ncbi:MAG: hypothetical protein ACE5FS_10950, partial [Paracoccaceae bacterium]